jgi:hypothetical protein
MTKRLISGAGLNYQETNKHVVCRCETTERKGMRVEAYDVLPQNIGKVARQSNPMPKVEQKRPSIHVLGFGRL